MKETAKGSLVPKASAPLAWATCSYAPACSAKATMPGVSGSTTLGRADPPVEGPRQHDELGRSRGAQQDVQLADGFLMATIRRRRHGEHVAVGLVAPAVRRQRLHVVPGRGSVVRRTGHDLRRYQRPLRRRAVSAARGMVFGMATRKVTVTLEVEQLEKVRALVAEGKASSVSGFVQHAVGVALDDVAGWEAMLVEAVSETGGPLSADERRWADAILGTGKRRRTSVA